MAEKRRIRVGYVWKEPGSRYTTYGITSFQTPEDGFTAETLRAALNERYPGAEMTGDAIRRVAAEAFQNNGRN